MVSDAFRADIYLCFRHIHWNAYRKGEERHGCCTFSGCVWECGFTIYQIRWAQGSIMICSFWLLQRFGCCEIFTNDVHSRFPDIGVMAVVPVNFIWKLHHYWDMSVITSQIIDNSMIGGFLHKGPVKRKTFLYHNALICIYEVGLVSNTTRPNKA